MVTLQEYLDKKYPTKEKRGKVENFNAAEFLFEGNTIPETAGSLDLSDYVNVQKLYLKDKNLASIDLGKNTALTVLILESNELTSIDFLNSLSNPEKLKTLVISNNKIQPTDIAIFSRFKNIECLKIGTMVSYLREGKRNKFYGSFESWKDLSKLDSICIEATDVDRGLEYLSMSLAEATKILVKENENNEWGGYSKIECSSHDTNAKCAAIQNELRPYNYDLEAWQLVHPKKMLIARPELFTNPDSKDKWLTALNNKILQVREEIITARENEQDKTAKIARLEAKISELELAKSTISQQTQTDFATQDKGTQTDLTAEQITKLEQQNQQLLKLLRATETELNNTRRQIEQLQDKDKEATEEAKQLQSKIKLLEQQKDTYQTKYDKSIKFIKDIRNDLVSE